MEGHQGAELPVAVGGDPKPPPLPEHDSPENSFVGPMGPGTLIHQETMKSNSVNKGGAVEPRSVNHLATSAPGTESSNVVDLDFTASGHLYATHPLHAFAARCPPPLTRWAIERYSNPGDVVLDPMCGSGTTLVEATLAGRKGWGVDIDPLARLIAEAKGRPTDPAAIGEFADRTERQLADGVVDDGWRPEGIDLSKWFRDDVAVDLARLRVLLNELAENDQLRAVAWTAFSSLIVARTSVANARDLVHSRHHFQDRVKPSDVPRRFVRSLRSAAKQHAEYAKLLEGMHWSPPGVVGLDARALPVNDGMANLVFTSPPYCSALD